MTPSTARGARCHGDCCLLSIGCAGGKRTYVKLLVIIGWKHCKPVKQMSGASPDRDMYGDVMSKSRGTPHVDAAWACVMTAFYHRCGSGLART